MSKPETKPVPAKSRTLSPGQQSAVDVSNYLTARRDLIGKMLSDSKLDADKVIASAVAYVAATPSLWGCDLESVRDAVVAAAKRNLLVGPEGYAYLVPFKEKKDGAVVRVVCQYMLGYKGVLELLRRSGAYSSIEAFAVYENEVKNGRLQVRRGTDGYFRYEPILFGPRGKLVGVMVFAKLTSGEFDFEAMEIAEVDAIKARSKASDNGPWVTDYERMALKTVIKRFGQRGEMSAVDRRELHDQDELEFSEARDITPRPAPLSALPSVESSGAVRFAQQPTQAERIKADLRRAEEPAGEEPPPPVDEDAPPEAGEIRAPQDAPAARSATVPSLRNQLATKAKEATTKAELDEVRAEFLQHTNELTEDERGVVSRAIAQADKRVHRG
jgi:recombination protein RecT